MIVDTHVHVLGYGDWPVRYFDQIAYSWGNSVRPRRDPAVVRQKIEPGLVDADGSQMVADMDAAGVDVAVTLPIDWGPDFDEVNNPARVSVREMNEHSLRAAAGHPGRLLSFAGIDPRRPEALQLLEYCVVHLGAVGLKLYPPMGFYPYESVCFPLYDFCQSAGIPVLIHTGMNALPTTLLRFGNPLYVQDVQASFPRLAIWMGHAGGPNTWEEAVTVAANGVNSYLELSTWIWHDTNEDQKDQLVRNVLAARDKLGMHRILFGSDHVSGQRIRGRSFLPGVVSWFQDLPAHARRLGLSISEDEMDQLMGGTATELLRLGSQQTTSAEST